ncbi:porin [Azohydromonas lata]|uniref:porin n=1 Tax=Azohydromonas lata TaxID=45677 RepID=UPI001EE4419C|nr:porin [Azohydromonas lata]
MAFNSSKTNLNIGLAQALTKTWGIAMKNIRSLLAASLCLAAPLAFAQNAVTIYGLIDLGVTHYSHTKPTGASLTRMDSGQAQGSRWGIRGTEDLGSGLNTIFLLESGFNADDGSSGQGGLLFGRQAYVGLQKKGLGTLTMGRQYDFMAGFGAQYAMGAQSAAGSLAWGLHADAAHGTLLNNHLYAGDRTNNSVKLESEKYAGFSAGAMYGFGEVAGDSKAGRAVSLRADYAGSRLGMGVSSVQTWDAAGQAAKRIGAVGFIYKFDSARAFGSWASATDVPSALKAKTYEIGVGALVTGSLDLSAAYQFQDRNHGVGNAKAFIAVADYLLSKRSDVYLSFVRGLDDGYNAYPVFGGGIQAANGQQSAIRVGLRHRF